MGKSRQERLEHGQELQRLRKLTLSLLNSTTLEEFDRQLTEMGDVQKEGDIFFTVLRNIYENQPLRTALTTLLSGDVAISQIKVFHSILSKFTEEILNYEELVDLTEKEVERIEEETFPYYDELLKFLTTLEVSGEKPTAFVYLTDKFAEDVLYTIENHNEITAAMLLRICKDEDFCTEIDGRLGQMTGVVDHIVTVCQKYHFAQDYRTRQEIDSMITDIEGGTA